MFRRRKPLRSIRRRLTPGDQYLTLEDRRMLSVSAVYDMGSLTIQLTEAGDEAIVDVNLGNVTVNGTPVDKNSEMPGLQPVTVADVTHLSLQGNPGLIDLAVQLNGDFDSTDLESVSLSHINQVRINGFYRTTTLEGTLVGDDGLMLGNGVIVADSMNLHSDDAFDIQLENENNDFVGETSITTQGEVRLRDANDLLLGTIDIGDRLYLTTPSGSIHDNMSSSIEVERATFFEAVSVDLGRTGSPTDLRVVISNVSGEFALTNLGTMIWASDSTVGSANISAEFLTMGASANIEILNDAVFDVDSMQMGVGGSNTFRSGRLSINAAGNAFVWQNAPVVLFSSNSAANLDLIVEGSISNAEDAVIEVNGITSFQSTSGINIGNRSNDEFNTGSVQFFAANTVSIAEDSDMLVTGRQNTSSWLRLRALGTITDADDAYIFVNERARLVSLGSGPGTTGVSLGDSDDDFFVAGSISFDVVHGVFDLKLNSSVLFVSADGFANRASSLHVEAMGNIDNEAETAMDVEMNARFRASNIRLGDQPGDRMQFGSTTLTAGMDVELYQENSILFTERSFVGGDFVADTAGSIHDDGNSRLTVLGTATLRGSAITLGNSAPPDGPGEEGNVFRAGLLAFYSEADVNITEMGDIVLTGSLHHANVLRLNAVANMSAMIPEAGDISNLAGATLEVFSNLFVRAEGDIVLGADANDSIQFDNLNFSSPGIVDISAIFEDPNEAFFIFGFGDQRNTAAELILTTNVDVRSGTDTVLVVDDVVRMSALSITLGEPDSEEDCIVLPADRMFNVTNGLVLNLDEACPQP